MKTAPERNANSGVNLRNDQFGVIYATSQLANAHNSTVQMTSDQTHRCRLADDLPEVPPLAGQSARLHDAARLVPAEHLKHL